MVFYNREEQTKADGDKETENNNLAERLASLAQGTQQNN